MNKIRIAIGSDHAAVAMKDGIAQFLADAGARVEDMGTTGTESVDYPDFAARVGDQIVRGEAQVGILLCGTGIGMAISANKIPGIRAAVCHDVTTARLAREHNDANVLCIGARTTGALVAMDMVRAFLQAKFEGGRHQRRVEKIRAIEERTGSAAGTGEGASR